MGIDELFSGITEETASKKKAEVKEAPKPQAEPQQEEEVDTVDRTIPLLDRLPKEMANLKFSAGLIGKYELATAAMLGQMLTLWFGGEIKDPNVPTLIEKWDENKWTLQKLWAKIRQTAEKELNSVSGGVDQDVMMEWVTHILMDEKPIDPKPKQTYTPPTTTTAPKPKAKDKPKKEEPKHGHVQLSLLDDLIGD